MSLAIKINDSPIITFDLDINDIVFTAKNSAVPSISNLEYLNTQAQLCSSINCYNCTENQCNQIHCTQVQCNQVQCNSVTVQCKNCNHCNCNCNCTYDAFDACYEDKDQ